MPKRQSRLVFLLACAAMLLAAGLGAARPAADSAILFIGDGMGPAHIELAREAAGQPLAMDHLPYSGTVTTLSAGGHVTDSAAGATALATGIKTNNGMVGVAPDGSRLETILERCRERGKSVGIITTDALTGATPASFAAHVSSRDNQLEIAPQIARSAALVLMGFGKDAFLPKSAGGDRTDGQDLVADMRRAGYRVVSDRVQLLAAKEMMILGLFEDDTGPALAEMVEAALPRLAANPRGFFLIVEGARVDWEAHGHDAAGVIREVLVVDRAVEAAANYSRRDGRTLLVVTADHETGGLELAGPAATAAAALPEDPLLNAPSALTRGLGSALTSAVRCAPVGGTAAYLVAPVQWGQGSLLTAAVAAERQPSVSWSTSGHTATPVRAFALGPTAERFAGEMDNTDIPKRIAAALGVGPLPR